MGKALLIHGLTILKDAKNVYDNYELYKKGQEVNWKEIGSDFGNIAGILLFDRR